MSEIGKKDIRNSILGFVLFAVLLALVACGTGGEGADTSAGTPTPLPTPVVPEKPIYPVQLGQVVNTLEFIGRVSPVQEQELFFKSDGFVAALNVARGDQVQAGDLLAELEIGDLLNRLAQQQLALETAEVQLTKAEQSIADQSLEAQINLEKLQLQLEQQQSSNTSLGLVSGWVGLQAADRELADAQEAYNNAWDEARDWELYIDEPSCLPGQGGAVSCTGLPMKDRLENDRNGSEQRVTRAQDSLTIARAEYNDAFASQDNNDFSLEILQKDIELAEHRIEQLERGVDPLLALDVERAQLEIVATETLISDAQLVAPFEGQVLSVGIRPGDSAGAFRTVLVLADPGELEITAELGSEALSEMSVGQPAALTLRSRPEEDFSGIVRQLPYPYGGGTGETDETDTAVRISLNDPDFELEMGELATVILALEEKDDVLWLPPAALRSFQGRTFVVVQDEDGSQRRVDVRAGIESDERVEIIEGLEAGQIVVGE
jgi:HlyD family secretion protein